jgi:hypothetical protein
VYWGSPDFWRETEIYPRPADASTPPVDFVNAAMRARAELVPARRKRRSYVRERQTFYA